jgi:hypothetical protein
LHCYFSYTYSSLIIHLSLMLLYLKKKNVSIAAVP